MRYLFEHLRKYELMERIKTVPVEEPAHAEGLELPKKPASDIPTRTGYKDRFTHSFILDHLEKKSYLKKKD
jgi:hypothetical protein